MPNTVNLFPHWGNDNYGEVCPRGIEVVECNQAFLDIRPHPHFLGAAEEDADGSVAHLLKQALQPRAAENLR